MNAVATTTYLETATGRVTSAAAAEAGPVPSKGVIGMTCLIIASADSEQHLSFVEQRHHHVRLALTEEREHEKIQLLVVGNDCTGSLLPARDRSGVASLDPRQRPHNPNEPFWHNLLLARRLARLSRHYWLACTVNCNGVRHYGRGQTGTCRTRARAGALLAFRRCGLGGRIHGCLPYWTLTRRTLA